MIGRKEKDGNQVKTIALFFCVPLVSESLGLSTEPPPPEGILSSVQAPGTNYCHLKFPAIREETLSSDHPTLMDAGLGDIIDFYGPCDHDPLGKDEIQAQEADVMR
jgi:hypothetical protein